MNKNYLVHRIGGENHLEHIGGFKYLDKKWINGRWQYIYDAGKAAVGSAGKVARRAIGLDAREERNRAHSALTSAQRVNRDLRSKGHTIASPYRSAQMIRKHRDADAAQKAYDKTLAGRAENLAKDASKTASKAISRSQKALRAISEIPEKADKSIKRSKAKQNAKRIEKSVSERNAEFKQKALSKRRDYSKMRGFDSRIAAAVPRSDQYNNSHNFYMREDKAQRRLTSSKLSAKEMKPGNKPHARYFDKDAGWQTNNADEALRLDVMHQRRRKLQNGRVSTRK